MRPSPLVPSRSRTHSPHPAPAIASPDDFSLQINVQLDTVTAPHLLPLPSGDDTGKVQVLLRNARRWGNMYDRFESSPPLRPRVQPFSQDTPVDEFSWEATHAALLDPSELSDPSRCSLLIHEVSLLVGLTGDDSYPSPDDGCLDPSKQAHDILPLNLTPTRSLAPRKPRNAGPTNTNVPARSSDISVLPGVNSHADIVNSSPHSQRHTPVGSRVPATPIPRHKSADAARPSLSPRRRQGQVFESPLGNASHRNAVDPDEMFSCPRKPPPKPDPIPPANRCSSLDRLEYSLLKLQAHAPANHRKSRSEGRPSDHAAQSKDKRPSLPPPSPVKQQQTSHGITHRNPLRAAHDAHFSGPLVPAPRLIPPHQYVVSRSCPAVPLAGVPLEEEPTPGSFMDMDVPLTEEARPKRRASFRDLKSKEKVKSLTSVARRVSRGVVAWGKNLTGSTKPGATK